MHRPLFTCIVFLVSGFTLFAQKEYKLVSTTSNADLSRRAILSIDTAESYQTRQNAFKPVKGNYTVYQFMATYKGWSHSHTDKEFHDLLVLKTDKKNRIIAAYQYTVEWAEMPLAYDVYQAMAKGVVLANGLSIEKLAFRRARDPEKLNEKLNEEGVLVY